MNTRYATRQAVKAKRWRIARRWVYGVTIAAIPFGINWGWFDQATAALIPPLVLALVNVKTPEELDT